MGASGGGKTTVLRLIGGQVRAQSGLVLFDGQDVGSLKQEGLYALRRRMGMLFQFGALFTDLNVFDNVAFPLREHTRWPESKVEARVREVLASVCTSASVNLLKALWLTLCAPMVARGQLTSCFR